MQLTRRNFAHLSAVAVVSAPSLLILEGCDTAWLKTAKEDLPTVVSIVDAILSLVATYAGLPPTTVLLLSQITPAIKIATNTLVDLLNSLESTKDSSLIAQIDSAITTLTSHIKDILSLSGLNTNVDLTNTVNAAIALVLSVLSSIQMLIPASPLASTRRLGAPQKLVTKVVLPTSAQIKTMFNSICVLNGYSPYQVR